jgi:hypothetical protein
MEDLFSPCTRYRDIVESQGGLERVRRRHPELLWELNLNVSTEELLSTGRAITYADLYAMLRTGDTIAWLTPHAAVVRRHGEAGHVLNQHIESCGFCFSVDGKEIIAVALSPEHLLEICDVVLRLLTASVVHSIIIDEWSRPYG